MFNFIETYDNNFLVYLNLILLWHPPCNQKTKIMLTGKLLYGIVAVYNS